MKKRVISLLLALVLALGLLPTAAWAAGTRPQGSGTEADPYSIGTAAELEWFRDHVNGDENGASHRTDCAKLTADITLTGEWTPISNKSAIASAYSGTFDGDKHTISGLQISATAANQGLFGLINGATIQNLKVSGEVSSTKSYVGGIVGKVQSGTIKNCSFAGTVTTSASGGYAGGIVGGTINPTTITGCSNKASINGGVVGGILGFTKNTTIQDCYNTGDINGQKAGGIVGQNTTNSTITNAYNKGNISGTDRSGDITGFNGVTKSESNCYGKDDSISADKLGDAFTNAKDDSGNVILKWEAGGSSEPQTPGLSISSSNGSALWTVEGGNHKTTTVLTVKTSHMGDTTPVVTWEYTQDSKVAKIYKDDENPNALVVDADGAKGGQLSVTASVEYEGETYISKPLTITVIPNISTVEIKNVKQPGAVAVGQTVRAQVNILGGGEYDYEKYPKLTYQWYRYNVRAGKSEAISDATGQTYTIEKNEFDGKDQQYKIGVNVACNGETVHSYNDHQQYVRSAEYGKAYVVAQDIALPTDITEETVLTLPAVHTKDGETVNIEWSSKDIAITDNTVKLTLPESGKKTIKLSAKCTLADTNTAAYRTFTIYVWSPSSADENTLNEAASKLENMGALYPRFGKDSNVQTMVETRLAKEFPDVGVTYTGKTPQNATANEAHSDISENGNITYFYTDLTTTDLTTTLQRFDTYKASFTLTCGKETKSVEIPVIVYWDADKVKQAMTEQIVSKVTLPETTEKNFDLPKVVDDKKWTQIEWTSSDRAVTISTEKQGTADTLFEPYVGVVTRQTLDQQVELTAKFTFQLTDQQIVLYKVFYVTVKGNADAADRAALYQQKLNDALAAPGLKDFVTGEELTADANGVYTTSNDIQFPTTRDLKIDGKYTPVVITSSDPGVIEAPTTPNSARVWVYRPLPGEAAKTVTLTMKILDRPNGPQPGDDLSAMRVLASKEIKVTVQPLTQTEINAEIALMERVKVKVNYWNGIRNANVERDNVTTDLHAFQECYLNDNGELTWVYDREDLKNHGIVPVPLDNWYDQQIWRLFRSSNADVVAHENLLVTRQEESKAVTVTSYLSSETLGRYAEKYPQNADFQKLYKQPVTIDLVVTGTQYAQGVSNTVRMQAARRALAARPTVTVSFSLSGRGMGFAESDLKYAEGSTVYDVFSDLLAEHGYTCKRRGSYIAAITSNSGITLEEFDEGKNSGWMYRVNGELVGRYMSAQGLKDGDRIELYFTSDWTSEPGAEGWQKPGKIETIVNADGSVTKIETKPDGTTVETTTKPDGSTTVAETKPDGSVSTVEKRADGTEIKTAQPVSGEITASVSVPKSVGSTRVDIPVSKPTGSMVAVIVHPDGTEEIVKGSIVTETGIALRAEGDVRLKIIDNAKRFNDMADHWAKDAVEFASSRELFNGVGNDAFGPDLSMTRGMVSTVLARLAGADTAGGETWYAKGTVWAVENGISDGTAPEQPVTREQLAAMLYRYAGSPAVSGELSFDDTTVISIWAYDAVRWCVDNGILNGVGGNRMAPQDLARRGQVAAMLMRFLQATV